MAAGAPGVEGERENTDEQRSAHSGQRAWPLSWDLTCNERERRECGLGVGAESRSSSDGSVFTGGVSDTSSPTIRRSRRGVCERRCFGRYPKKDQEEPALSVTPERLSVRVSVRVIQVKRSLKMKRRA